MVQQWALDDGRTMFDGPSLFRPFQKRVQIRGLEMWEQRYPVWRSQWGGELDSPWECVGLWEYDGKTDLRPGGWPDGPPTPGHASICFVWHYPISLGFMLDNFAVGPFDRYEFHKYWAGEVPGVTIRMLYPDEWTTIPRSHEVLIDRMIRKEQPSIHRLRPSPRPTSPFLPLKGAVDPRQDWDELFIQNDPEFPDGFHERSKTQRDEANKAMLKFLDLKITPG